MTTSAFLHGTPPGEYLTRYEQILAELDPAEVASQVEALAGDKRGGVGLHPQQWCLDPAGQQAGEHPR